MLVTTDYEKANHMSQHYDPEFKKQIVRLHLEEGRTLVSLQKEYIVSKTVIFKCVKQFRDEYQKDSKVQLDYAYMKENLRVRNEIEEAKKKVLFLKKL